ncbi:hypothetical protein [Streptomyces sp. NPDC058755]|uniref:hypothetical protein n=1 Tax=Streptomyces sp. NPDC058755 TaxID=3346624 RepID=UPI003698EDA4
MRKQSPLYSLPKAFPTVVTPYHFDESHQLNVLPDGSPALSGPDLLLTAEAYTSRSPSPDWCTPPSTSPTHGSVRRHGLLCVGRACRGRGHEPGLITQTCSTD